jgi:preprotein translocase subunit SecE
MNEVITGITTYLKGVRAEWGKISWPERQQVIAETLFVLAIVVIFTLAVYLMDVIFKWGLSFIPHR